MTHTITNQQPGICPACGQPSPEITAALIAEIREDYGDDGAITCDRCTTAELTRFGWNRELFSTFCPDLLPLFDGDTP